MLFTDGDIGMLPTIPGRLRAKSITRLTLLAEMPWPDGCCALLQPRDHQRPGCLPYQASSTSFQRSRVTAPAGATKSQAHEGVARSGEAQGVATQAGEDSC